MAKTMRWRDGPSRALGAQNLFLSEWERTVADTRIHGTTRQQVGKHFETIERAALQPLPASLFPVFEEARRTVHRDGYVEFKQGVLLGAARIRAPGLGRWDTKLVRVYNTAGNRSPCTRGRTGKVHHRSGPSTAANVTSSNGAPIDPGSLPAARPVTGTWAEAMHQTRGPQSLRVMQGLLHLAEKHPAPNWKKPPVAHPWRLAIARSQAAPGPARVVQLDFLETHP